MIRTALAICLGPILVGCGASFAEPSSRIQQVCELNSVGEQKACHDEETSSARDFDSSVATVRCWQTAEGERINCTIVRAPDAAQYQLLEFVKKSRGQPVLRDGKPIEGWVMLVTRLQIDPHP